MCIFWDVKGSKNTIINTRFIGVPVLSVTLLKNQFTEIKQQARKDVMFMVVFKKRIICYCYTGCNVHNMVDIIQVY